MICALLALVSCSEDYHSSFESVDLAKFDANYLLSSIAASVGEGDAVDVVDDIVVEGVVTANDQSDNFYQTYVIESNGAAIEINEGISNSFVRHRLGYVIALRLQGLRIKRYKGVMQIGLPAPTGGDIASFGFLSIADMYTYNRAVTRDVEPLKISITELKNMGTSALSICGRLVTITGVGYAQSLVNDWFNSSAEWIWSGYRPFVSIEKLDSQDSAQDSTQGAVELTIADAIWVNTSSYANFSAVAIPEGELALTGILYYGAAGTYSGAPTAPILKLRDQSDISIVSVKSI